MGNITQHTMIKNHSYTNNKTKLMINSFTIRNYDNKQISKHNSKQTKIKQNTTQMSKINP